MPAHEIHIVTLIGFPGQQSRQSCQPKNSMSLDMVSRAGVATLLPTLVVHGALLYFRMQCFWPMRAKLICFARFSRQGV